MFQVYLPIAEISVNLVLMLGLGAAVGFLSGMFGVGGGFLLTPFLMFSAFPLDRGRDGRQPDRRHLRVGRARAVAAQQYRFPHGRVVDRRRRGRRADRRDPAQDAARGAARRADHLADLCRSARHRRPSDARRKHARPSQDARGQAGFRAQAWSAQLDPPPAVQAPLPALAALYQRHSAARDRLGGRAAHGLPRRRRRLHHGAGDDLSVAHADQYRASAHRSFRSSSSPPLSACCMRPSIRRSMWCSRSSWRQAA